MVTNGYAHSREYRTAPFLSQSPKASGNTSSDTLSDEVFFVKGRMGDQKQHLTHKNNFM